jgi:bis(5'-adenosyl)-triphosphatase
MEITGQKSDFNLYFDFKLEGKSDHFFYLRAMTCPFCETTIQDSAFAISRNFLAVYNLAPILPGHSLIIPIKHVQSVLELTPDELSEMTSFACRVTRVLIKVFNAEAFNWSIQDKEIAGQTLAHLHMHIVLRFEGDLPSPGDWYPELRKNLSEILDSNSRQKLSTSEMKQIVDRLRKSAVEEGLNK